MPRRSPKGEGGHPPGSEPGNGHAASGAFSGSIEIQSKNRRQAGPDAIPWTLARLFLQLRPKRSALEVREEGVGQFQVMQ